MELNDIFNADVNVLREFVCHVVLIGVISERRCVGVKFLVH